MPVLRELLFAVLVHWQLQLAGLQLGPAFVFFLDSYPDVTSAARGISCLCQLAIRCVGLPALQGNEIMSFSRYCFWQ